jgi:hypothetical protein
MIPGEYNISVYQGDTFSDIAMITVPDLTSHGGPADLSNAEVTAQIRSKPESPVVLAEFDIEVLDAALRQIRPTIPAAQTAAITAKKGFWDLQVTEGDWSRTILKGEVTFDKQVTRQ